jgi:hypothetical protein
LRPAMLTVLSTVALLGHKSPPLATVLPGVAAPGVCLLQQKEL